MLRRQDVGIHAQAHRATRLAPLRSGFLENAIQSFVLGRLLHGLGARNDQNADIGMHLVAVNDFCRGAKIFQAAIGAGSDKYAIDGYVLDSRARF